MNEVSSLIILLFVFLVERVLAKKGKDQWEAFTTLDCNLHRILPHYITVPGSRSGTRRPVKFSGQTGGLAMNARMYASPGPWLECFWELLPKAKCLCQFLNCPHGASYQNVSLGSQSGCILLLP